MAETAEIATPDENGRYSQRGDQIGDRPCFVQRYHDAADTLDQQRHAGLIRLGNGRGAIGDHVVHRNIASFAGGSHVGR